MFVVLVTYCAPQTVLYIWEVSTLGKAVGGEGASVTLGPRFEADIQHMKQSFIIGIYPAASARSSHVASAQYDN